MSDKFVECPICGVRKKSLYRHINSVHCMNRDEFRERFPDNRLECSDTLRKLCSSHKESANRLEVKEKRHKYLSERWKDPDYRESQISAIKSSWDNPENRNRISKKHKDSWKTEEYRESVISTRKSLWEDESFRSRRTEEIREVNTTDEYRETMRKIMIEKWKDPLYREIVRAGYRGNEFCSSDKTVIQMRSSWEVIVAEYLTDLGISFEYEPRHFEYWDGEKSRIYIPDFYLHETQIFLEVKPEDFVEGLSTLKAKSVEDMGYSIHFVTENHIGSLDIFEDFLENIPKY